MSEPTLTLPEGWELENGSTDVAAPGQQSMEAYGGATMNWALDGASIWHLGCCAKKDGGSLYFSIFTLQGGAMVNVPLTGAGTGRGWLDVASDGWMYWSSWEGSSIRPAGPPARVPGAVQVQSGGGDTSALEQRIATLEATIASLPPTTTGPTIRVPASGGNEGGEIQLAATDGGGPWSIDVHGGTLRLHRAGKVAEQWPK